MLIYYLKIDIEDYIDSKEKRNTMKEKPPAPMLLKMESNEVNEADERFPSDLPMQMNKLSLRAIHKLGSPNSDDDKTPTDPEGVYDYDNIFNLIENQQVPRKTTACFGGDPDLD